MAVINSWLDSRVISWGGRVGGWSAVKGLLNGPGGNNDGTAPGVSRKKGVLVTE